MVLESKGYIIPAHQILVSPKVSGMIVELHLEEGRRVHKGDVLAVLETTDYDADFARAEAMLAMARHKLSELEHGNRPEEIAAAQAELAEAQAQREQLKSAWRRNRPLKGTKVLSDTDYEQSESQFKAMDRRVARLNSNYKLMLAGPRQERIELARAEVRQAEAELAKVQWRLDNCTIRAPISGTILKKNAEEGNIVNPVAFNGSYSVCDLADLADLEVDLSIQERDISRVRVGQRCQVRPEAFTDRVYEGVVSRLMPIADRAKGAVPVRVKLRVPAEEEGSLSETGDERGRFVLEHDGRNRINSDLAKRSQLWIKSCDGSRLASLALLAGGAAMAGCGPLSSRGWSKLCGGLPCGILCRVHVEGARAERLAGQEKTDDGSDVSWEGGAQP